MWQAAKGLLSSKKAMMAFISAVVWAVGKAGMDLDTDVMLGVVSPLWVYIFGQGVSDLGKAKAQIEATKVTPPAPPPPAAPAA